MTHGRGRILAILGGVLVLALVVTGLVWWLGRPDTRMAAAAAMAPADTQRMTFTDWRGVRDVLGSGEPRTTEDLDAMLSDGFDADLTSTSALSSSASAMLGTLGVSPATLEWELLSQGSDGAALFLRVPDDLDLAGVADALESLGYTRPSEDDGIWEGGPDVANRAGFTPELQHVALLADQHLVVASDQPAYVETAVRTALGDADPVGGLERVVEGAGDAVSAVAYTGDYTCEQLAMAQADPDAQAEGEALVDAAGGVHPVTGFALAEQASGEVTALFAFENDDQARADADSRAALASGAAPGQGGDFASRFAVRSSQAEGSLVRLDLEPVEGAFVMSDLTSGPVLFASC